MLNKIIIKIHDCWGGQPTEVIIIDNDVTVNLTLKILDKVIEEDIFNDKLDNIFDRIYNNNQQNKNSENNLAIEEVNKLVEYHMKWLYFDIILKKEEEKEYHSLIESIKNYKNEESIRQEKQRIRGLLDGYSIYLNIDLNSKSINFKFNTPDIKSHPKLVIFIKMTLKLFKTKYNINPNKIFNLE